MFYSVLNSFFGGQRVYPFKSTTGQKCKRQLVLTQETSVFDFETIFTIYLAPSIAEIVRLFIKGDPLVLFDIPFWLTEA